MRLNVLIMAFGLMVPLALTAAGEEPAKAAAGKPGIPIGRLVKMKGPLERNVRGNTAWAFVDSLGKVADGDRFRTGRKAFARFDLSGNLTLFQDENTSLRLESSVKDGDRIHLNQLTMLSGNVFLRTDDDSVEPFQHQVITPHASVFSRGLSSYALSVNPDNGTTTVFVLGGAVTVKNTLFEKTLTLNAGKKLYVDMGREIDRPDPIDTLDLRSLGWINGIDSNRIARESAAEKKRHERLKAILAGDRDDRILVCRFKNKSEYGGLWPLEKGLPGMLAEALSRSLGVTAETTDSAATDPFIRSQRDMRGLILSGVIDTFVFSEETRIGNNNETIRMLTSKIALRFSLISTKDRRTLTAFTVSDVIRDRESRSQTYKDLVERPFSLSDNGFAASVAGRNIQRLLKEITARLKEPMAY